MQVSPIHSTNNTFLKQTYQSCPAFSSKLPIVKNIEPFNTANEKFYKNGLHEIK